MSSLKTDAANRGFVEETLTYLALCDRGEMQFPDPMYFDGIMPLWGSTFDKFRELSGCHTQEETFRLAESLRGLNGVWFGEVSDPNRIALDIVSARQMDVVSKQNYLKIHDNKNMCGFPIPPESRFIEIRYAEINRNGVGRLTHREFMYEHKERNDWPTASWTRSAQDAGRHGKTAVCMAVMSTFLQSQLWTVRIRFAPQTPSVAFVTDSTGVRDFLRFREIDPGAARRKALVHWVSDHWRQTRNDPDTEAYVREFLRGRRVVTWHGMQAEILIPDPDKARERQAIERRAALPADQSRRPRKRNFKNAF